jgi:prepilin-type N-terminal cleavage/methylation domain-containing protein
MARYGVTLIEVIVASSIVAVAAVAGLLCMPQRDGHSIAVRSESKKIVALFRLARQQAIASNASVDVSFESVAGKLAAIRVGSNRELLQPLPTANASGNFQFRPDGSATQSVSINLGSGNTTQRVSVVSAGGVIRNEKL